MTKSKRTTLEKQLIALLAISLTTLAIIVFVHIFKRDAGDVCNKASCVYAATRVLSRMNSNVNPCDDFYQFACGHFVDNTFLPDDVTQLSSMNIIDDTVSLQVKSMLEKPIGRNDKRSTVLVKTLYATCMNTTEVEANSMATIQQILKSTGGWPVLDDNWDEYNFDWVDTGHKFMLAGISSSMLINFGVGVDMMNSSKCVFQLDQPKAVVFQKQMRQGFTNAVVMKFYEYLFRLAMAFGSERHRAEKDMRDVVELYIVMSKIIVPPEERRDLFKLMTYMTVNELQKKFPYIQWKPFINTAVFPIRKLQDEVILVSGVKYYEKLQSVIDTTPRRTLANYMYVEAIQSIVPYLTESVRKLNLDFTKILTGIAQNAPRWKECSKIAAKLPAAIGALYVKKFFKKESKVTMMEMVNNVREEFIKTLTNLDWMDPTTREHALQKAKSIRIYMGYPDEILDDAKVDNLYANVTLNATNYLQSILNLQMADRLSNLILLDIPIKEHAWIMHSAATSINAFYYSLENSIDFRASIMQDAFFDNDRPQYMNYGSIGYAIGHELTHGFDDRGRQFDKDGNLIDWWEPKTMSAFKEKAQCIIDQYSNVTVPEVDMNLNGILTQGENIADNGGIKEAYQAYENWVERHGVEPKLPGLSYAPLQMFWISFATTWCIAERPETLKTSIGSNTHAPNKYRVNIPLMNSKLFSKDFNCPIGSKMNPVDKCEIW